MADENDNAPIEDSGGSLADAIAAHLELKREHGADPELVEHELEEALAPPRRDEEPRDETAAAPEPAAEVAPEPEPGPSRAAAPEAEPEPVIESAPAEPATAAAAPSADVPKPGEITGTIEFEFGDEETAAAETEADPAAEDHDLLEDTPDFFEETPEHDKLWFDEAPPRKFDF